MIEKLKRENNKNKRKNERKDSGKCAIEMCANFLRDCEEKTKKLAAANPVRLTLRASEKRR